MKHLPALILALFTLASCSTTRLLTGNQSRLVENKVHFNGRTELKPSSLSAYAKQTPNTHTFFKWSPGLSIYNWADTTKADSGWNRFCSKVGIAPVIFDGGIIPNSIENMENRLEYLGYYGSKVTAVPETRNRLTTVHYYVDLGKRYRIDSIDFSVPEGVFSDEFADDMKSVSVKPGDWLSESALEEESIRSTAYFRNLGYYDFSKSNYFFEADTLGSRNILHYAIKNHTRNETGEDARPIEKYRFGDISISHSKDVPFSESLLRKINILKPGQLYSEKAVNVNFARFSTLRVFNSVGIELQPQSDHTLDCSIDLRESKMQGVKFNIEASTNSSALVGIAPKISYFHKNIFHGGERLSIDFSGNFQFKPRTDLRSTEYTASVALSLPRFVGLPMRVFTGPNIPRTDFSASYSFQDRPEYVRNIASFSYGYNGQIGDHFFYQVSPVQINYVRLNKVSDSFQELLIQDRGLRATFQSHFNAGLTSTWYYTSDPALVPKASYYFVRLNIDGSGNVLSLFNKAMPVGEYGERLIFGSPYSQFVRAELNLGKTFRWGAENGQALAMRLVLGAGVAYGNSSEIPYEKQFFAGGANGMRAWRSRSLGPGFDPVSDFFSIPSQSGNFKFEFDMEYRFKMFWKLEGALFAEVGNVWDNLVDYDVIRSLAGDWGLGLRLNLDFILVRLDGGFKVYEPSRDEGARWVGPAQWFNRDGFAVHLGIGYPF